MVCWRLQMACLRLDMIIVTNALRLVIPVNRFRSEQSAVTCLRRAGVDPDLMKTL